MLIGGRGKAGGVKIAKDVDEARQYATDIIGMDIVGPHGEGPFRVDSVWVEGGSDIAEEYYASIILDRGEKKLLAMVSAKGGMDIEAVATENPADLTKVHIDPTGRVRRRRGAADRRGRRAAPRTLSTKPPTCWRS